MTDACNLIQQEVLNALEGADLPTYMATFGNSAVTNIGDWVAIQVINPLPAPAVSISYTFKL